MLVQNSKGKYIMKQLDKIDWEKMDNLIPVITQDSKTNEVLMLAYMNQEALELTIKTNYPFLPSQFFLIVPFSYSFKNLFQHQFLYPQ